MVVGEVPTVKMRSWGVYIRLLKGAAADAKVLAAMEQVKDLHRNPVMHPELQLSVEEALSLLGIIESLIMAIFRDMQARAQVAAPIPGLMDMLKDIIPPALEAPKPASAASDASAEGSGG